MIEVKRYITLGRREPFTQWLDSLDPPTRSKIQAVLERMERGILSDIKSLGGGLFEGRINFGPGYRIYFVRAGRRIIVLLGGGDKGSQGKDIRPARRFLREYVRGI